MDALGNLQLLLRHSLNATKTIVKGDGIPDHPNPVLKIRLAVHDCEGLHKEYEPLSFTFQKLGVRVQESFHESCPEQAPTPQ